MKIAPINIKFQKTNFKSLMQENSSEFEIEMLKIFNTYHKKFDEIESLFENKLITFIEKLEKREELVNWRNKQEALLKQKFNKTIKATKV